MLPRHLLVLSTLALALFAQAPPPARPPVAPRKPGAVPTRPAAKPVAKTASPAPSTQKDDEKFAQRIAKLWSLQPVNKPEVPLGTTTSTNPIDAFIALKWSENGLKPVGPADKATLLRRVTYSLIGLPPTPAEQNAFLSDDSPEALDKVVDRLLASEQHGVRWARHWLDVLRYTDVDAGMPAANGIHYWRDWVINALNKDMPYDEFVRAQLLGSRYKEHTTVTATGYRVRVGGPQEDTFALGFLSRAALTGDDKEQELALNTVETVSTAFMGMTVGCAKCHDHKFDPIRQRDFYAMKAIFDPLVVKTVPLATPSEIFANGKLVEAYRRKKEPVDDAIEKMIVGYRTRLYSERLAELPTDVQAVMNKAERLRTAAEQKIADDYFPILRIDPSKIKEVMKPEEVKEYNALIKQQNDLPKPPGLAAFVTVEEDSHRLKQPTYILDTGDPAHPMKDKPVEPGFPFAANVDFREGRREGFADWLTGHDNPLFARVAVNRIWAWHFGEGLHRNTSDFGVLGSTPTNQKLLDYLAAEFVAHNYSMKWLHKFIISSDTYQLSSKVEPALAAANADADARNSYLWHFRLERLEAEPIWDTILSMAGDLDDTVGGKSFSILKPDPKRREVLPTERGNRRAAYMRRGYIPSTDVMANFLQAWDVDDGRTPCPIRTQTVTAPQALFSMNDELVEKETAKFADRVLKEANGDVKAAVTLAFRYAIGRTPVASEMDRALTYLDNSPDRMKGFSWLLVNLDEFIFLR